MSDWIREEYRRNVMSAGEQSLAYMKRYGVPFTIWGGLRTSLPAYGFARVITSKSGFYEPSPEGTRCFIQPAVASISEEVTEIYDLVAWPIDNPSQWWVRTGLAPVLDHESVDRASLTLLGEEPEPLVLHATPLDYLRAGCTGTVVLRENAGLAFWLGSAKQILTVDGHQTHRLTELLQTSGMPEIKHREEVRHAA
jgi:hypothetical protein